MILDNIGSGFFNFGKPFFITHDIGDTHLHQTRLPGAQHLTRTAKFKVFFCHLETIIGLPEDTQALFFRRPE